MSFGVFIISRPTQKMNSAEAGLKDATVTLPRWAQRRDGAMYRVVIRVPFSAVLHEQERLMTLGTILIIILILILIGALPTWGYSSGWGYGPGGIVGVILIIIVILVPTGQTLTFNGGLTVPPKLLATR